MNWPALVILLLLALFSLLISPVFSIAGEDYSDLEKSFTELCSQTENAEALSVEELTKMVARCDLLKDRITRSTHPKKKVLLFRLKKCRNFLDFIIQTKQIESEKQE